MTASEEPRDDASTGPDEGTSRDLWRDARRGAMTAGRGLRELGIVVVTALVLSFLLRTFVFQLFYVPSESMMNTLLVGDKIVASRISMTFGGVHRGDVVVFQDPGGWLDAPVQETGWRATLNRVLTDVGFLPSNSGEDLVKRVVGVAGDEVKCCSPSGQIVVNGHALDESAYTIAPTNQVPFDITVPQDHVFVLGDNRPNSRDSRFHLEVASGTIPVSSIKGIVVAKIWPLSRLSTVPAPQTLGSANR